MFFRSLTEAEREKLRYKFCSWMAEGMATYSSAKFMENLGLIDFKKYMLELRKFGGNIGGQELMNSSRSTLVMNSKMKLLG